MERQDSDSDTALTQLPAPRPEPGDAAHQPSSTDPADAPVAADAADAPDAPDVSAAEDPAHASPLAPPRPPADDAATRLGARERAVLDFEMRRWKHAGEKEEAIRATFELSATRYYQTLNALLDDPAALEYRPALITRLRRIRDARREARG